MKKLFHLNITKKLIIYLLLTSFIPLLLFGIGTVSQSQTILKNEMDKFTNDLLSEKQKNVELMMRNAESLIANIIAVEDITTILSNESRSDSSFNKLAGQENVGAILSNYSNVKGLISIDIFSFNQMHYHVGDTLNVQQIRNDLKERLMTEALSSKEKYIWNGIEDNVNVNSDRDKVVTLSAVIKVFDKTTMTEKPLGVILVNLDKEIFCDAIKPYGFSDASYTLIDSKNRIICDQDKRKIGTIANIDFIRKSKSKADFYNDNVDGKSMFSTYSVFEKSNWVISGSIPKSVLREKTSTLGNSIIMLLLTCIFLAIILSALISREYLTPIIKITRLFKDMKNGSIDLKIRLETNLKDEIGQLVHWFNTFLESLEAMKKAEVALEKELRNDFRRTVENLQNIVFKLKLKDEGEAVFTLFEGKLAHKLFTDINNIIGKRPGEVFQGESSDNLNYYSDKAFKGEITSFEASLMGRFFYITLSPIIEKNKVVEVVGSVIDITEHKEAEQKIRFMAYYDSLTSLPNRILLKERLNTSIAHANRNESIIAIMFLDLDHFKIINDTLGHVVGDRLLQEVGKRLVGCVDDGDTVSRMGGDEFILLFPYIDNEKDIEKLAQKVLEVLKQPFFVEDHELYITTSIGISIYPLDGTDMDTLIKNADMAMYRAKEQGRNNYQFFTTAMNKKVFERLEMERSIRKALERDEFTLFYQPKVDLKTGRISGAEALIRWIHPKHGFIPPNEFIPIAEESGLIVPIGEWVLKTACKQSRIWMDGGYEHLSIAVNISAKQFQQNAFIDTVIGIIKETGVNPSLLELEITENSIMQDTNKNIITLNELKAMGLTISIDDFGTGFSSLSYIMKFAADILKIDKSFISNIAVNSTNTAITVAIINMAHSLNLKVIAEGVETEEQLQFLREQNCNEMQGYLFSKPIKAEEFELLLTEGRRL